MNPAYVSAFAALMGAIIGGFTSFGTTWFTQRTQHRNSMREANRTKLEALYNEYITVAARLHVDALTHQTEDLTNMVPLYAIGSRMRLVSSRAVIDAAVRVDATILDLYLKPNPTVQELEELARRGGLSILTEFSEACRDDLAAYSQ